MENHIQEQLIFLLFLIALLYYISTRLFGRRYFNYNTPHHN